MIKSVAGQLCPQLTAGLVPARPAGPGGPLRAGPPCRRSRDSRLQFLAGFT